MAQFTAFFALKSKLLFARVKSVKFAVLELGRVEEGTEQNQTLEATLVPH